MDNKEQLVSLKVMRLLKPSIYSSLPVYTEEEHFTENLSKLILDQAFHTCNHISSTNITNSCLTDTLVIPQIFGNLYIGETFTSYICLYNQSVFKVRELQIKVELQTTTQKYNLPFKSNIDTVSEFEAEQKFDGIVEYDVKELGNHILICMVSYLNEKMERMSFKKFYKFIVSKPFEIQPRYPYMDTKSLENMNSILFEAQIQNVTNSILFIDNVELHHLREDVKIVELREQQNSSNSEQDCRKLASLMKPSEVKQYLFRIEFRDIDAEKRPLCVGKLDISWRYSFGESGHLQTHPLEQPKEIFELSHNDIELYFENLPQKCYVDETILFDCVIKNKSERELELSMKLENEPKTNALMWNCALTHDLGKIMPKNAAKVRLGIVPLQTGLSVVSGISITDLFLKRVHDFSKALSLFILSR